MENARYLFVFNSPIKADRSRRAIELERSSARSHAARVSFSRTRGKRQILWQTRKQERDQLSHDVKSDFQPLGELTYQSSRKIPHRTRSQENHLNQEPPHDVTRLLRAISTSTLDPFLRPATDLSVPDKHLLHHYLTLIPDAIFGVSSKDVSHMIRDAVIDNVSNNEFTLSMILLSAESADLSFQPTNSDRQISILKRRGQAYRLIRKRIVDAEESSVWQEGFTVALGTMAATEKRLGNMHICEYHRRAVKKLVDLHGGLRTIQEMDPALALMLVNILIEVGVHNMHDRHSLPKGLARLRQKLQQLQAYNYRLRIRQTLTSSTQPAAHLDHDDARHLAQWISRFKSPALAEYIRLPPDKFSDDEYRSYLAALYTINTAFWAFRHREKTSTRYLDDLEHAAEKSEKSESVLRCFGAKSPTITLLIMLTHYIAALNLDEPTPKEKEADADAEAEKDNTDTGASTGPAILTPEELLDFVELMMMATPRSRDIVLRTLWSYLSSAHVDGIRFLSNATLDMLADEIEDEWRVRQAEKSKC